MPEKTWSYNGKLIRKGGALKGKNKVFALYVLEFKSLAGREIWWKMEFQKASQIDANLSLWANGSDFGDFGAVQKNVSFWWILESAKIDDKFEKSANLRPEGRTRELFRGGFAEGAWRVTLWMCNFSESCLARCAPDLQATPQTADLEPILCGNRCPPGHTNFE